MSSWLPDIFDTAVGVLVEVIVVVGAVLVLVGLVQAVRGRRRTQLVILDIASSHRDATVAPDLSSRLRQRVRRLLDRSGASIAVTLEETVGADINHHLVDLGVRIDDVKRIDREVQAEPRDNLDMLSSGARVIGRDRGETFVAALKAALPEQRGLLIRTTALSRELVGLHQTGLAVDIGAIGHASDASATFWTVGVPVDDTSPPDERNDLDDLLKPAAEWVGIYVDASCVSVRPAGRIPWRRSRTSAEERALHALLAAQLASYKMNAASQENPFVALAFAEQALDDARRALRVLRGYFRPYYVAGTIHDSRGDAYLELLKRLPDSDDPDMTALREKYQQKSQRAFDDAARAFGLASARLEGVASASPEFAQELRPEFRNRRLKAALHGSNPGKAFDEVRKSSIEWNGTLQHYNVACLYAVASSVGRQQARDGNEFARRARRDLAAVFEEEPKFLLDATTEPDLKPLFTADELRELAQPRRRRPAAKAAPH